MKLYKLEYRGPNGLPVEVYLASQAAADKALADARREDAERFDRAASVTTVQADSLTQGWLIGWLNGGRPGADLPPAKPKGEAAAEPSAAAA